jgi:hypothetical protein
MTSAALNLTEVAEFWRVARRLHTIYAELDRTFEMGTPPCPELQQNVDRSEPAVLERVRQWFDQVDSKVQVWQLRQLLQSTNLQTEENLRYLIARHLDRARKTEADKEKIDFLLVQYFAYCTPQADQQVTLESVARVLEPALGEKPATFPDWAAQLDDKLRKMNECNSLEELQDSGGLVEVREMKTAAGDQYFQPAYLAAFTRFNFLARRAFFRAMHLDLHAIRSTVNELEHLGFATLDCREAGLSENESLEQVRHVIHQWKTPFRAPYSGGSSFHQLILLRKALSFTLESARKSGSGQGARPSPPAKPSPAAGAPPPSAQSTQPRAAAPVPSATARPAASEDDDYMQRCVADITEQLAAMPPRNGPGVSTIHLGGCKLMIATWEAEAFRGQSDSERSLQRAVAARTILHVCMDRYKKKEPTDLSAALEIAQRQAEEMKVHVIQAKEAMNIDAAVNLAATAKRLLALVDEGQKLHP